MYVRGFALVGLIIVAAVVLSGCTSDTGSEAIGPMVIDAPWVRVAPVGQNSAAYMRITNETDVEDRLISASAEVAPMVQIHETIMEGDVAHMQELPDGLVLPVGEAAVLAPGGIHVMLMGLEQELAEGDTVALTLNFEQAGEMVVDAPVRQDG